jgi:methyltransferase (TIGR00027 family)
LNLAAGLDTRPYRLELPQSLRWIEIDLPPLIEEKERLLRDARPHCELVRIKADLAESDTRAALLQNAVASARNALVITEGLLIYLDEAQVRALAADLCAHSGIRWWVLDLASPELLEMLGRTMGPHLANAPMKFAPENGVAYFEALGWNGVEVHSILRAARRLRRLPFYLRLFALLPEPNPRSLGRSRWSGVVKLERAAMAR